CFTLHLLNSCSYSLSISSYIIFFPDKSTNSKATTLFIFLLLRRRTHQGSGKRGYQHYEIQIAARLTHHPRSFIIDSSSRSNLHQPHTPRSCDFICRSGSLSPERGDHYV